MKKLVLGLLLTAGICENAWASEGKSQNQIKSIAVNCTIYTTVTTYDSEGKQVGQPRTYQSAGTGSQCDGAVNGKVYYQQTTCIQGTSVEQTENCN